MKIRYIDMTAHPGGLTKLTVVVEGDRTRIADLVSKARSDDYEIEIVKLKKQRGLNANAYYWKLVDKLASALGSTKQEIHSQLLGDYGTMKTDSNGEIVTLMIKSGQDPTEYVDYPTYLTDYGVGNDTYSIYGVCKGSSEMTSAEFAKLLDGAIYECKELGIEVLSDIEIKRMIDLMER